METRNSVSSDTWLHGTGTWRVYLRVLDGSFLGGWGPFAQGYWRWDLILTDLPAFPHSGKLGLQSLREGIKTCNPGSHLEDRPAISVYRASVAIPLLSPDPQSHSPLGLAHSAGLWQLHQPPWHWLRPPGSYGSVPPAKPAAPEALQPADTSAQGWPLHSQLGPCHSLSVRKLPQKMDLWDSRRKKCLSPLSIRQRPTREARHYVRQTEAPKSGEARKWLQEWPGTGRPLNTASYGSLSCLFSMWGAASYLATLLSETCYMHSVHVHTGESKAH
jgi:hypothetical protein